MNEIDDAFCPNKECKNYGLQDMVIPRFVANMAKIRSKICYTAGHAASVLRQREQPHFLDFIYQMKKWNKSFITPQRALT